MSVSETAVFSGGGSFESTPLVWEGRVYIGSRDGYLYCLGVPE
ncbi:MAG: PQQ-binding-like beta-propeller repeat protein [Anaerosomatales bacterium]